MDLIDRDHQGGQGINTQLDFWDKTRKSPLAIFSYEQEHYTIFSVHYQKLLVPFRPLNHLGDFFLPTFFYCLNQLF